MIDCADSTTLRTHLDHADAELDAHLDECEACTRLLHSVADDAGFAQRHLALLDDPADLDVDVDAALADVRRRIPVAPVVPIAPRRAGGGRGRRLALAGAAAVVVIAGTVTPAGRSAVAAALDAFRGQRLQPVLVDIAAGADAFGPDDVAALAELGDLDTSALHDPEVVPDVAAAEALAGIEAPTLPLPGAPRRVVALAPGTARLTLRAGGGNGVPDDLDGATLVVEVPGAIGAVFGPADGPPEVAIGRAAPLVVRAEGASLDDLRSFLLTRDELPADLRRQLADIDDWRSTIPVPVPVDGPGWQEVEVAGRRAIAFGDGTGLGAIVVRQDPDGVTVVGGRIGIDRALALAARA
jgi:hypothetical protein